MANNNTNKKTNGKNNGKGNNKNTIKKEVVKKDINKKEEHSVEKKVHEEKNIAKKVETVKKEEKKKSFSLSSKQKDIILILLVVVLLIVGVVLTSGKKEKFEVELPVALAGEAGFTEITYSEYETKVEEGNPFLVIIVRDGCGYCEMYEPIVEEVANEYKLPIYYINLTHLTTEETESLSTTNTYLKRNEWGTPTTLFMYGTHVVDSISGYVEKDAFVEFVKENFVIEE